MNSHNTAIISSKASIGKNVTIGPYCIVNDNVKINDNVKLIAHVYIDGNTTIGESCVFYPYSSIGTSPQDLKYKGEATKLIIGANNTFREYVTINPGTEGGGSITSIGNNCLFMINSHVAHDCIIGNNVIMVNKSTTTWIKTSPSKTRYKNFGPCMKFIFFWRLVHKLISTNKTTWYTNTSTSFH